MVDAGQFKRTELYQLGPAFNMNHHKILVKRVLSLPHLDNPNAGSKNHFNSKSFIYIYKNILRMICVKKKNHFVSHKFSSFRYFSCFLLLLSHFKLIFYIRSYYYITVLKILDK